MALLCPSGSVSMVAGAAQRVDECVGEGEEMQRLLVLQKALHNEKPNIIAPGRKLLKTGLLHKVLPELIVKLVL